MKRKMLVTSILVLFLVPALVVAAESNRFVAAKSAPTTGDMLVVPLEVTNVQDLVALDIPLGFSEGAVLEKVVFTDRVKDFQLQVANIDNENRNVVIGLISMVYSEMPDLPAGAGTVAELHFQLDPGVEGVEIRPIEMENPNHSLTYYYNDYTSGRPEVKSVNPEFEGMLVTARLNPVPATFALYQNKPNPFNPATVLRYDLPAAGDVRITVFNVLGQQVIDLVNGYQEAGSYEVTWDGRDRDGATAASGIYFYQIKANQFTDTKKMVLLK